MSDRISGRFVEQPILPRLEANTIILPNGCWEFTGCRKVDGYGQISYKGRLWRVHRLAYILLVGPIPEGMQIDHVRARGCITRACWNTFHLEAVTNRENTLRGDGAPAVNILKTHCAHGHPFSGENLYIKPSGERCCRTCRREERQRRRAA